MPSGKHSLRYPLATFKWHSVFKRHNGRCVRYYYKSFNYDFKHHFVTIYDITSLDSIMVGIVCYYLKNI